MKNNIFSYFDLKFRIKFTFFEKLQNDILDAMNIYCLPVYYCIYIKLYTDQLTLLQLKVKTKQKQVEIILFLKYIFSAENILFVTMVSYFFHKCQRMMSSSESHDINCLLIYNSTSLVSVLP